MAGTPTTDAPLSGILGRGLSNWQTTTAGAAAGVLRYGSTVGLALPHDQASWLQFGISAVIAILGLLAKDATTGSAPGAIGASQKGSASPRLLVLLAVLTLLGLWAGRAFAGANILTNSQTLSQTPGAVGSNAGRALLEVAVPDTETANAKCGPINLPTATWWVLVHGGASKVFGVLYKGQFSAERVIGCVASSATPVVLQLAEEGGMADRTSTPTATPTATPVNTATATATATAT